MDHGLAAFLVFTAGSAGFGLLFWYASRSSPDEVREELYEDLESAGLVIDADTRAVVVRQRLRRNRWQALGGALGMALGAPLVVLLPNSVWPDPALLSIVPLTVGTTLGALLGSRSRVYLRPEQPRVTTLRPYRMTDYLRRREMAAELLLGAAGVGMAIGGGLLLLRNDQDRSVAWGTALVGLLMGLVSVGALVWQHQMLRAPRSAASAAQVVANDVIIATGFRDLTCAAGAINAMSLYALLFVYDAPLGYIVLSLVALLGLLHLIFATELRPDLQPVAHRISARAGVA